MKRMNYKTSVFKVILATFCLFSSVTVFAGDPPTGEMTDKKLKGRCGLADGENGSTKQVVCADDDAACKAEKAKAAAKKS